MHLTAVIRRYNPAVQNRLITRILLAAMAAMAVAASVSSCDYPEAGYYSLTGYDASGTAVIRHAFQIEELVDDTELTYGYALHLYDPGRKTVVDIPIDNSPDISRRGWLTGLTDKDYGHGDLALDLTHVDSLTFVGAWREYAGGRAYPVAGTVEAVDDPAPSPIDLTGTLPQVGATENHAVRFVVDTLTEKKFVALVGAPLKNFKHVKGTKPDGLDPELGRKLGGTPASGVVRPAGE